MCILMTMFSPYSAVYTTRHLSIYNWFKEKIDIVKETHFTAVFLNSDDWRILDEPFLSFFLSNISQVSGTLQTRILITHSYESYDLLVSKTDRHRKHISDRVGRDVIDGNMGNSGVDR